MQLVEIKTLYAEKSDGFAELMKVKDELNKVTSSLQDKSLRESFFDKERALLESQIESLH